MPPGTQPPVAGSSTITTTPRTPRSRTLSDAIAALPDLSNKIIKSHAPYRGAGAFSDVYKRQYDGGAGLVEVAVKSFRFSFALDETQGENAKSTTIRKMIRRELGVWGRLKHPNIVPFLGIAYGFGKEGNASLVSMWMVNGTLHDFLEKHDLDDRLTISHRLQLLLDIGNGINYLHSFPFVHGDLTCNNVLLDHNYNALLADFGYTSMVGDIPEAVRYLQMSTVRPGTLRWAAPEHFAADEEMVKQHTTKSDIYSFGNLAHLVLSGKQPWWEFKREEVVIIQLSRGNRPKRPLDRPIDNHHWELIERCWSSMDERPSAYDVISFLKHALHALLPSSTIRHVFHVDPVITSSAGVRDDPSNDIQVTENYMINNQSVSKETARNFGDAARDVAQIMAIERSVEQEQQSMANTQGQPPDMPKIHEQPFLGLPPGVPRPPPMEANSVVNVARESEMADGSFVPDRVPTPQNEQQPTWDQIQHAVVTINHCRLLFQQRSLPGMPLQHIPEEQQSEYNQMIEQVFNITSELEPKLPLYFAVFKNDELLRRYVAIVMTVARQRQLSNSGSPQYIIGPVTLRNMQVQVLKLNEEFESRWCATKTPSAVATISQSHATLPSAPTQASSLAVPQVQNIPQIPTPQQLKPSQTHLLLSQPHPQSGQSQPCLPQSAGPPQVKKNIRFVPSFSAQPPLTFVPFLTPPPAAATSPSSTPSARVPTFPPMHKVTPTPVTLKWAPFFIGAKRPPEEDVTTLTTVVPSEAEVNNVPSLKKAKTGWGSEPSQAFLEKQRKVENIETGDDATAFFDRMKELSAMMPTDSEIHHDLTSTLDQTLAGVAEETTDAAATALSVHGAGQHPITG